MKPKGSKFHLVVQIAPRHGYCLGRSDEEISSLIYGRGIASTGKNLPQVSNLRQVLYTFLKAYSKLIAHPAANVTHSDLKFGRAHVCALTTLCPR